MGSAVSQDMKLTMKDFVAPVDVRWCPGCGDYAILSALRKTFPTLGIPKENFVVLSGIGCSSRLPYYMNTYGFHTVHGRVATFATGVKVANPDLSVWVITGDGDALSIGANHMMHLLRRNVNVNVLLFNNRIYGLTKGQFSPTSEKGKKTKTSPRGSIERPVDPLQFALTAGAGFVARTYDINLKHMQATFTEAAAYPGVSFIEIWQNCPIFNDGAFQNIYAKETAKEKIVFLENHKPFVFGEDNASVLNMAADGNFKKQDYKEGEETTLHDEANLRQAQILAQVREGFPVPAGVLYRRPDVTSYDGALEDLYQKSLQKKVKLDQFLLGDESWTVDKTLEDSETAKNSQTSGEIEKEEAEIESVGEDVATEDVSFRSLLGKNFAQKTMEECVNTYGIADIYLFEDDSFLKALRLFKDKKISALFAFKDKTPVGIVLEEDLVKKVLEETVAIKSMEVSSIMRPIQIVYRVESSIEDVLGDLLEAYEKMGKRESKLPQYIPFLTRNKEYVLLPLHNLVLYFSEHMS